MTKVGPYQTSMNRSDFCSNLHSIADDLEAWARHLRQPFVHHAPANDLTALTVQLAALTHIHVCNLIAPTVVEGGHEKKVF